MWFLLAAVASGLLILIGLLSAVLNHRRAVRRSAGVFPAKIRVVSGPLGCFSDSWPRRVHYARWVHDVLMVHRGIMLMRCEALAIQYATGSLRSGDEVQLHGLGSKPLVVTLVLDSGTELQLAAPSDVRTPMVGPFLVLLARRTASHSG